MPEGSWEGFESELRLRRSQYHAAVLTAAVDLEDDEPRLIAATLVFVEDANAKSAERRYDGLHLIRRLVSVEDGAAVAQTALRPSPEPSLKIEGYLFKTSGPDPWVVRRSSDQSRFGIEGSSTEHTIRLSSRSYGPREVLAAEGLPSYPNAIEAVMDWFGEWSGIDSWLGMSVVLPEYRARLKEVTLEGQRLRVEVSRSNSPMGDESFQVSYFAREGARTSKGERALERDVFEEDLGISPAVLSVVLLDRGANVVDWRYADLERGSRPPGVSVRLPAIQFEMLIQEGEGPFTEFKQEVREGEWSRIAQTAVAFANFKGGTIVVGVDDKGDVVGVLGAFPTQDDLARAMREWVEPDLECRLERWEVRGKSVVVISVPEGTAKPYFHKERGPLIRRGSNNLPMKRVEVIELARR